MARLDFPDGKFRFFRRWSLWSGGRDGPGGGGAPPPPTMYGHSSTALPPAPSSFSRGQSLRPSRPLRFPHATTPTAFTTDTNRSEPSCKPLVLTAPDAPVPSNATPFARPPHPLTPHGTPHTTHLLPETTEVRDGDASTVPVRVFVTVFASGPVSVGVELRVHVTGAVTLLVKVQVLPETDAVAPAEYDPEALPVRSGDGLREPVGLGVKGRGALVVGVSERETDDALRDGNDLERLGRRVREGLRAGLWLPEALAVDVAVGVAAAAAVVVSVTDSVRDATKVAVGVAVGLADGRVRVRVWHVVAVAELAVRDGVALDREPRRVRVPDVEPERVAVAEAV